MFTLKKVQLTVAALFASTAKTNRFFFEIFPNGVAPKGIERQEENI